MESEYVLYILIRECKIYIQNAKIDTHVEALFAFGAFLYRLQNANLASIAGGTLGALGHDGAIGETDARKAATYMYVIPTV